MTITTSLSAITTLPSNNTPVDGDYQQT